MSEPVEGGAIDPVPGTASRRRGLARLARRAGWNVVDQALSSLSNLVLSILVARAVDSEAFGAFTVSFTVYSIAVLVSRGLVSEPLMVRHSGDEPGPYRIAAGMSSGAAAVLGLSGGVVVLVIGLLLGGGMGTAFVAMALLLPGLLVQDAWRVAFLAQRRPQKAALLDGAWMVLQVAAVAWLLAAGVDSTVPFLVAWGLAAAAAAVLGAQQGGTPPRVLQTWAWLTKHWDLTRFLVVEALLLQGAYQGALLLVGAFGSLSDVGSLRGAQVVLGPITLLTSSALAFGVPELSHRTNLTARHRILAATALGSVLAVAGLVWGAVVLLLPADVGVQLMGDTWAGVRSVLLPTVLGQAGNLLSVGAVCVIYAMGAAAQGFRVHALVSVLIICFGMGGLWLGGAEGAAWGFALAYWLVIPFWFRTVVRLSRAADAEREAADPEVHEADPAR